MINEIFKYSISISCDDKKRQLQDIVFRHVGLPETKTFKAVTTIHLQNKSDYPLFEQFYNKYQFGIDRSILKHNVKQSKKCCSLSHLLAIYSAMINNWPYVLIFEDDAWPNINAKDNIPKIFNDINNLNICNLPYDILVLGWNEKRFKNPIIIKNIHNNSHYIIGSHAYIVFQHAYEKYINNSLRHPKIFLNADWLMSCTKNNISNWCSHENQFIQFIHKDFKTLNVQGVSHKNECLIQNTMFYILNRKYQNTPFKNFVDFNDLKI